MNWSWVPQGQFNARSGEAAADAGEADVTD
jgi:hypothetical protein